ARRQAGGRLAVRLSPPVPQIRQLCALFGLCFGCACSGRPAATSGVSSGGRSSAPIDRAAGLPARAVNGTGITCGQAVNAVVLSGATGLVLSGASPSCYQAHELRCRLRLAGLSAPLNLTNLKALTCYWGSAAVWTGADRGCLVG